MLFGHVTHYALEHVLIGIEIEAGVNPGLDRKLNEHTPAPGMDRANLHLVDGSQEHERTLSSILGQPL